MWGLALKLCSITPDQSVCGDAPPPAGAQLQLGLAPSVAPGANIDGTVSVRVARRPSHDAPPDTAPGARQGAVPGVMPQPSRASMPCLDPCAPLSMAGCAWPLKWWLAPMLRPQTTTRRGGAAVLFVCGQPTASRRILVAWKR